MLNKPINDLCLNCQKADCPGICAELRESMGDVERTRRGQTITWHGVTRTIGEWAEVFGMSKLTLQRKLHITSDIEAVMEGICNEKQSGTVKSGLLEKAYIRLSTMHIDYELYWKRLEISEGSAGLVARYGAVQSSPTNRTSNPVERRAMPEITLSDEALERRAWVACVLYCIEHYRMHKHVKNDNSQLKAAILEQRAIFGWTMRRICDEMNKNRMDYEDPMTIARLRRFFQIIVMEVCKEAERRGLFAEVQK